MPHGGSLEELTMVSNTLMLIQPPLVLFPPPIIGALHPVGLCNFLLRLHQLKPWTLCPQAQYFSYLLIWTSSLRRFPTFGPP